MVAPVPLEEGEDPDPEVDRCRHDLAFDAALQQGVLQLRRHDRLTTTHACRLHDPTQRAETILAAVTPILRNRLDGTRYRLIGVTAHDLVPGQQADPPDLFNETT